MDRTLEAGTADDCPETWQESIGEEDFFSRYRPGLLELMERGRFLPGERVFLFSKRSGKAANRNERLDGAGAERLRMLFGGDSHGSAGQRPVIVETAEAFGAQRGARGILQQGDQSIGFGIGELINERRLFQRRSGVLEDSRLFGGDLLNILPFMLIELGKSFLECLHVEDGDGERPDATVGTAGSTGDGSE